MSRGDDPRMRVLERLDELYAIGGGVGANRPGYSAAEDEAHELAAGWMRDAGLDVEVDAAGNLIGRNGDDRVWTGSHLDSVPSGGKFDGALGVVSAIEAVERIGSGAVVAFLEEETGCTGSRAFVETGDLPCCFLELHIEQGPRLERAGAPLGLVTGITGMVRGDRVFEGEAGHAGTVADVALAVDLLAGAFERLASRRD
jgi:acetylornithine deacetylase/succinyl-diaminopimelate desuccinylase-like protein